MQETERRFAVYSRKSRFTGKGESIGNQVELCRQYIALHYGEEASGNALIYEDEGYSGGTLERPQLGRMMRDAAAGRLQAIVVYRLDRISRSIGDFAALIEKLGRQQIAFISIREQFDTASPMGRAMMYIASVFSQLERETIAERIRDNMHELAKSGRWLGGVTPLGYRAETVSTPGDDGKIRRSCRLVSVPEECAQVRHIYGVFLQSGSLTETEALLRGEAASTRSGRPFTRFALRAILQNPVYMIADEAAYAYLTECGCLLSAEEREFDGSGGVMVYNRTEQRAGRAHTLRPMEEWIAAVGAHAGIIPGESWVRVQRIFARRRAGERKAGVSTALLSGILYCGQCGARMRVKLSGSADAGGVRQFRYICTAREKSRGEACRAEGVPGAALDRAVLEALTALPESGAEFRMRLRRLERQTAAGLGGEEAELPGVGEEELLSRMEDFLCAAQRLGVEEQRELIRALVRRIECSTDAAEIYLI